MKKALFILILAGFAMSLKAQFIFPAFADTAETKNDAGDDGDTDTAKIIQAVKDNINDQKKDEKPQSDPISDSTRATELELRKLELRAQRLRLEKEIKEMNAKPELTPEEKEILAMKNENLKLVLQKEKILLAAELEQAEKSKVRKNYPPGSVYGHQFFREQAFTTFQTSNEIVATEGYVLGSGDVVQLEVWGERYWSKSYTISENGSIDLQGYQKLFLKGLSLRQAREMIGSRLGLGGQSSSFSITVTRPRTVTVNIMGEVFSPGSYTLPATNTLFNALVFMGGPNNMGSVRNIYIKRDGRIIDSFDVYEYFADIRHQRDVYLQNNDYIIVTPLVGSVSVAGSVRRPGNYEMKPGEGIRDLIRYAGGNQYNAYLKDVVVSRFRNNSYELLSINLDSLFKHNKDFKLYGGETITFKEVRPEYLYNVQITGAVSVPGAYRVRSGMKLSDVLKTANGLTSRAYLEKGYLVRTNTDLTKTYMSFNPALVVSGKAGDGDLKIENSDSIYIFNKLEFQQHYTVSVSGPVRKPGTLRYIDGLKLGELVFMLGGLTDDADTNKAYILRTNSDLDKKLIPFEPGKLLRQDGFYNFEMMPRDEVFFYSKLAFKNFYSVSVSGAVNSPININYAEGMKLGDLIRMAGGLNTDADETKGFIIRTNDNMEKSLLTFAPGKVNQNPELFNLEIKPRDEITIYGKSEFRRNYTLEIQGPVKAPKQVPFSENIQISDMINLAGGLELTAFKTRGLVISTDLETGYQTVKSFSPQRVLDNPNTEENITLPPNSVIRLFDMSELRNDFDVSVYGEVRRPGDFHYADNMSLQNLVDMAGGFQFISAGTSVEVVRNFYLENGKYEFLKPKIFFTKITNMLTLDSTLKSLTLQPFDRVFIRKNPDFMPLKMVYLEGAIRFPGYYALQSENEKLASIYKRAGGFRTDADVRGIRVWRARKTGDSIEIVLNSKKAIHRRHSRYNIILRDGDKILIPYAENLVTISGDVNKLTDKDLGVYYIKHKRAKYYIRNFAGGFTETSDKKHVVVVRANGARVATRSFLFFRIYPKVKPGCKILVTPVKVVGDNGSGKKGKKFDLDLFLGKLTSRTTAVLSIVALYKIALSK